MAKLCINLFGLPVEDLWKFTSPSLSSCFSLLTHSCDRPPVSNTVFRGWPDYQEASYSSPLLSSPLPPCVSSPPSSCCCCCGQLSPGEALGRGQRRGEPGAVSGAEAGPRWRGVRRRSARSTWRPERSTWTARTGSWPPWCRTGPKIFTTCCWREIGFRYAHLIYTCTKTSYETQKTDCGNVVQSHASSSRELVSHRSYPEPLLLYPASWLIPRSSVHHLFEASE